VSRLSPPRTSHPLLHRRLHRRTHLLCHLQVSVINHTTQYHPTPPYHPHHYITYPHPLCHQTIRSNTNSVSILKKHVKLLRSLGWRQFVSHLQHPSDLSPNLNLLPHPAASLLHTLNTHGVPAKSTMPPWTKTKHLSAIRRGAHPSATRQFRTFLHEDLLDMVQKASGPCYPTPP
jgi:hypothetical protein